MYADLVREDSPAAWWPMDDAGTTLREIVGGATATAFGTGHTFREPGLPFPSAKVAGNGGWTFTPTAGMLGANYTIECWANFDSFVTADISSIYAISGAAGAGWRRFLRAGQGTTTSAFADSAQTSTSSGSSFASAAGSLVSNKTYHLAFVYSGGTGTPYINGVAGTPTTTSNSTPASVASMFGYIGKGWADNQALWPSYAKYAHIAQYNTALSAARVLQHYLAGLREGVSY